LQTSELEAAPAAARPPRAMAWVLLLASAAAVLLTGLFGTAIILGGLAGWPAQIGPGFWIRMLAASGLTVASLALRSLRWVFLLRRAETRIPIRDAYIGYFAGLSLLLAPFLLGEIAVRALVLRARGRVPVATTVIVNLWERLLDLVSLALIAGTLGVALGGGGIRTTALLVLAGATLIRPVRALCLRLIVRIGTHAGRAFDRDRAPGCDRLARTSTWLMALATSIVAWTLPGIGFWALAGAWGYPYGILEAENAYATSASLGGLVLSPGGVLVAGSQLLDALEAAGFPATAAALSVFGIRLATVGVSTVLGVVFLLVHRRSPAAAEQSHFDAIADAYDVQIPEARREALLTRKTELMREVLDRVAPGGRGLDVGCGQGAYVARMRALGFDVTGLDTSAEQVQLATNRIGISGVVTTGSVLRIPAADNSHDFAYAINVLHHLSSVEEQRLAFAELVRVLRPGGVLFVHEINTRNILFRFYMGYVFPSLNCIDEGVERWLLPHRMTVYTDVPVADIRYFTFLPDFLPGRLVRLLTPIERLLEASPLGAYSAHYMAVLRKPI
jgi:ubiquinone/menaquinone biosynthesis C-methylase UbiE/uncharacterized membrane protein YbhN (UPF0104 family)